MKGSIRSPLEGLIMKMEGDGNWSRTIPCWKKYFVFFAHLFHARLFY